MPLRLPPSAAPNRGWPFAAAALGLGLLLVAAAPAQAKDPPAPVAVDAGFKPAEQAAQLVAFTDPKWARELKRVAVTQFSVEFVTYDSQSARTSTFGGGGASVTARWTLAGVGEPEFQAAAEAFHARFLQDLAASGLEVVPNEQVLGGAALLEVRLRVHFVDLADENRGFLGRLAGSARVSAKAYPSVRDGTVTLHRDGGIVNLQLQAPLQLDAGAFASVQDQTATADPARWREVVGQGLGSAGQLFVERLRAAR